MDAKVNEAREILRVTREFLAGRDHVSELKPFSKQVGDLLFEGDFQFQRPDLRTQILIEDFVADLTSKVNDQTGVSDPIPLSDQPLLFVRAYATLHYVVARDKDKPDKLLAPEWFDLKLLRESEIIIGIFMLWAEWEHSFRRPVEAAQGRGGEADVPPPVGVPAV